MKRLLVGVIFVIVTVIGALASFNAGASANRMESSAMGVLVIVAYRPRPGKEKQLLELTKQHVPMLRSQGLATDRAACAMRARDGTIVEVFEWKSKEALASAHENPAVLEMWKRYGEVCDYVPLSSLKEASAMFAEFVPIDL